MRKDLSIYNDATGFIITSKGLNGRIKKPFTSGTDDWNAEVARGTLIPVSLAQDDSLNVRVVVDEDLTPEEIDEAYDRFDAILAVPDGKLAVIGGAEYTEDPDLDHLAEYGQVVKIAAGDYAATVLTYYHSPNALMYPETDMAAFFRETRKGKRVPKWVLQDSDDYDGDYDDDGPAYIAFVVHLRKVDALGTNPIPLGEEGWVPEQVNVTRPERCPLGLVAKRLQGKEKPYRQTALNYRYAVFQSVDTLAMTPVAGGPVSLPIDRLIALHWIAFCAGETHPALKVNPAGEWNPEWPGFLNGIQETKMEDGWTIEIEGMNARWSPFRHIRTIGSLLADLPDGSRIEADWGRNELQDELHGMLRFEGVVSGGRWQIEQTYPALDHGALTALIAFGEEADAGQGFLMRDEAERDYVIERCRTRSFFFRKEPPVANGLRLSSKDPDYNPFLAGYVFARRFEGVLPIIDWSA